ncbi:MAG: hypothetical protein CMM01_25830 [Rhodopirellula sp.]|nr:hypothetical protein [Rhodopirellula sp.]OUX49106.1 MAG: hypothetical protein CBE43_10895 [Rhodopirellula sp. TMED283]
MRAPFDLPKHDSLKTGSAKMMTALFVLALLTMLAVCFGNRKVVFLLSLATLTAGIFWFNHHITDPLKLNF